MSAGASPAIGPEAAASWQRRIAIEGWRARWLDERARPLLAPDELHIWSTDLEHAPQIDVADADRLNILSHEELQRARRMIRPHARRRWLEARVFLRSLLASYLAQDPRVLAFSTHGRGKPVLAERGNRALHFSLSHSGQLAVCALSRMCAVGIDVQLTPSEASAQRLARRLLGQEQAARGELLEPGERSRRALRAWTAFEAESKRTGAGLTGGERFSGPQPWSAQLELGGGGTGTVALALPPSQIGLGIWPSAPLSDYWIYSTKG